MSILYRPVLIESQSQADALPDGTIATMPGRWPRILLRDGTGQHWAAGDAGGIAPDMVGWTALVPVEAEEEWAETTEGGGVDPTPNERLARKYSADWGNPPSRRFVLPWEPVS